MQIRKNLPPLISAISVLTCAFLNKLAIYNTLWVIPFIYGFVYFIFANTRTVSAYNWGIVFRLANIACLLKYAVTPIAMIYQEYYSSWGRAEGMWGPTPSASVMAQAIIIQAIEVIAVHITFFLAIAYKLNKKELTPANKNSQITDNTVLFKNRAIIYAFCAVALLYILAVSPSSLTLNSLVSVDETEATIVDPVNHAGIIVVFKQILLISVSLLLWDIVYKKLKNRSLQITLSLTVLLVYLSLIRSYSRWDLLFVIITGFFVLNFYYGNRIKIFLIPFIILFFVTFIAISYEKFSYSISSTSGIQNMLSMLFGQMQDYFSGPRLVAQSIEVRKMFSHEIGLGTIFNDLLGNVPLLSILCNQQNRMSSYFNFYNFGNWTNRSLLMPMVGEGYCYLPFFPWYLSMLFSVLVIHFDTQIQIQKDLEFKVLYLLEGCWLAFALCLNFQTNWGHFVQVFIMTWIVFKINRKFSITMSKDLMQ